MNPTIIYSSPSRIKTLFPWLFRRKTKTGLAFTMMGTMLLASQMLVAQNINRPNKTGPMGIEVNTATGNVFLDRTDIYIPARLLDLDFTFSYSSVNYTRNTGYGNGWILSYNMYYRTDSIGRVIIIWGDGREDTYTPAGNGWQAPVGTFDSLSQPATGQYLLRQTNGLVYYFDNAAHKRLTKMTEPNGNVLNFGYTDSLLTSVSSGAGQTVSLAYNQGRLASLTDANASPVQIYTYTYDGYGNLTKVTDPMGGSYKYTYLVNGPVTSVADKNANVADVVYYPGYAAREIISCNSRTGFSYDTATHTTTVIDFLESGQNQSTSYTYNDKGWLSQFVGACCGNNMTFAYDNAGNLLQRTDAAGNVWKYTYDNRGNYLTVTDPKSNVTTYSYTSAFSEIAGITDALGNAYTATYDAAGNLTQTTNPDGTKQIYTYASNGDMLTAKDANNNTATITYDGYGNPQKISLPLNVEMQGSFDARGNLLWSKDANGRLSSFQYDSINRLKLIADPLLQNTSLSYDKAGNLMTVTDPKGLKRTFQYDASNRTVSYTDAKGAVMTFAYDAMSNLVSYTDALGKSTTFGYDAQNRLKTVTDAAGNGYSFNYDQVGNTVSTLSATGNTVAYTYDALNRIVGASDDEGPIGSLSYDKNGNVTAFTDAAGASVSFAYDNLNRLVKTTDPLSNSRVFAYDGNGNLLTTKDRNDHISSRTYNALNRVTSVTDANNNTIQMQYDSAGKITRLTDQNGHSTTYQYDGLNRLYEATYPDGRTIDLQYDKNSNVSAAKLLDGSTIAYTYDSANRMLTKTFSNGGYYNYSYDVKGRLIAIANAAGLITFGYDDAGRLVSENFNSHPVKYAYNLAARTNSVTYPDGTLLTRTFDKRSRMRQLLMNNQGLSSYQYNSTDQLTQRSFANGVVTNYQYDLAHRLSTLSSNSGSLPSISYQYDNEGNKTVISRANEPQNAETFGYDAGYRLISYKQGVLNGNTIPSPLVQNTYAYDAVGNRVSASLNGVNTAYTVNNLNQYTRIANGSQNINFTYDGNGNVTYDGNFYMRYDAEGRKTVDSSSAFVYRYQYDALGRRTVKSVNGIPTNYYYAGLAQIEERDGTDSLTGKQVFETSLSPLLRINNNRKYFHHLNHLNTTEAATDSAGNLVERYRYDDFGKVSFYDAQNTSIGSSAIGNRFLYTGQEYDAHTQSHKFHFRNYSPSTGSFSQRDPLGYGDQMGQYQYVGNNPATMMDPLGLAPCPDQITWDQRTLFWGGQYSNFGSIVQVWQSSDPATWRRVTNIGWETVTRNINGVDQKFKVMTPVVSEVATETNGILGTVSKYANSTPLTKAMLPVNVANTIVPVMDAYYNGSEWNAAQWTDNGLSFTSSAATTGVSAYALAGGSLSGLEVASVPGIGVPLAGGLAIEGTVNLGAQLYTGQSLSEIGYNQDFYVGPVNVTGAERGVIGAWDKGFTQTVKDITGWESAEEKLARLQMEERIEENRERIEKMQLQRRIKKQWEERMRIRLAYQRSRGDGCPPNGPNPNGPQTPPPPPPGQPGKGEVVFEHDPNEIIGPDGAGSNKWVSVNDRLPYTILFENAKEATAPAKVAKIYYPIDPKQDVATFQLGSFGFNNLTFDVPANTNAYYKRLDARDSLNLYVDVTAGIDAVSKQAFWIFESIDPTTLLPTTDPLKGFLLTADSSSATAGHGFVNFSIKPVANAATGDTISSYADIVFGTNDTIPTNRYKNTVDALPPTSSIASLPAVTLNTEVALHLTGADDAGGSGLKWYSVYVSDNGGAPQLYVDNLGRADTTFRGVAKHTYQFYVAATDSVGNKEQPRLAGTVRITDGEEVICPGGNITFAAAGGSTYQWQVDTGSGYANLAEGGIYSGTASATLTLTGASTNLYGYRYRAVVNGTAYGAEYLLKFGMTWEGTVSTAWENPANWSCGTVPDANTDVKIAGERPRYPQVNGSTAIRSLTTQSGAAVTVRPGVVLTVVK